MTTPDVAHHTPKRGSDMRSLLLGAAALVALAVLAQCGTDWVASRRADLAHDALQVGAACTEVVSVAERFANSGSAKSASEACASAAAQVVTLNFSVALSLNYLVIVTLSRDGRVLAVSSVEAW